jgi:hypothetical protein
MGEGVIEHRRVEGGGSPSSESYDDSSATKGLGGKTRVRGAKGKHCVGKGRGGVEEGERIKKHR